MTDFPVSITIEMTGDKPAQASLDNLDKSATALTDRVAKVGPAVDYLSRSMGVAQIKALEMDSALTRVNSGLTHAAAVATGFGDANLVAAEHVSHHSLALGRVEKSLEHFIVKTTGANEQLGLLTAAFGHLELGSVAMIGILGALFAVTKAYEMLTEKTREAAKAQEELRKSITEAANAGTTDPIREAARTLQFGQPFDKDHKLVANSDFVKGAFKGSLADLEAELVSLQDKFYATTNGFTQQKIQEQIIGVKESLKPMRKLMEDIQRAGANVLSQPMDDAGKLKGITTTGVTAAGLEKEFEKWASLQDRQIKGLSLAGALSATRVGQLEQEAKQWTAVANALGYANPQYERYMKLAHDADELVKKQDALASTASRAASAFAKAFGSPTVVSPGDAARQQLLEGMAQDPKAFQKDKFDLDQIIADQIKDDPMIKFKKAVDDFAKKVKEGLGQTLGAALGAGFEAAFSGQGVKGGFKALTASLLGGLGSLMEALGAQMIVFGGWVAKFVAHVATFDFLGQIEAGAGMIAAGALLKSIAGSFGGGSSSSAGSYGGSSAAPSFLSFGVQASAPPTTSLAAPAPRSSIGPNYFFGPDDPHVVRQFGDMVSRADRRGLIAWP